MLKVRYYWLALSIVTLVLVGCGGGGPSSSDTTQSIQSVNGVSDKGPFVKGSSVVAYKLKNDGSRSSTSVKTTTKDKLGNYSFNSIEWSGVTEITVSGKYFDENSGDTSTKSLTLSSIVNIEAGTKPQVNINILTDLEAKRVKALMQSGMQFAQAKTKAQKEVAKSFGIELPDGVSFEDLDPTNGTGQNALLNAKLLKISTAFSKKIGLLKDFREAILDGNITNNKEGSDALEIISTEIKDVNLNLISQVLQDKLGVKNPPKESNATDDDKKDSSDTNSSGKGSISPSTNHSPNFGSNTIMIGVSENNSLITTVSATDSDGDSITYSIVGGDDSSKFTINQTSGELKFTVVPDFETPLDKNGDNIYTVTVQASDGKLSATQTITVSVTNINDNTPEIKSNGGGDSVNLNITENNFSVTTVSATDRDGDSITYSIVGGDDSSKFTINPNSGLLNFISAPDFENPTDIGVDNSYTVIVQASDGSKNDTQKLVITITNKNEEPIANNGTETTAKDSSKVISIVGSLATDVDAGDSLTIVSFTNPTSGTIVDNHDGTLTYTPSSGFIGNDSFHYTVQDSQGLQSSAVVDITVYPSYSGTANPGDFINFNVIGDTLHYDVQGNVYGHLVGDMTLIDVTGNSIFFYGQIDPTHYVKVAKSDNLGIFIIPTGTGSETIALGLEVPENSISEASISNKSYIYAEIGKSSSGAIEVDGYVVYLNQNHSLTLYDASGSSSDGCWKVVGNHIVVKIDANNEYCNGKYDQLDNANSDVRVVIRPSAVGRAGFIADSVAGDFIGIGLEQKALDITKMSGTFDAYVYALDGSFQQFIQVEVSNDGTNVTYIEKPYNCDANGCTLSSDSNTQINGTITLNKTCDGADVDGVVCASDSDGDFMGFIDTESGYFMLANDNVLVFGAKHP